MNSLALLDPKTLDVIKRLAHYYAPDLEENIIEYVMRRRSLNDDQDDEQEQLLMDESPRTMLENKKQKLLAKNLHPHNQEIPMLFQ